MVEVGHDSLTIAEQQTHFNLWALSKSPLLIGTHVSPLPITNTASFDIQEIPCDSS